MAMGGVMVYLTRQWLYSLFMLMFPLMMLANWLGGRKQRGGSHRRKMRAYAAQMAEVETKLEQTRAADEKRRREDAMDPAQVLLTATGPAAAAVGAPRRRPRHAADADRAVRRARHDPAGPGGQGRQAARGADVVLRARLDAAHHDWAWSAWPGRSTRPGRWPAGWSPRPRSCTARATCPSSCWPPTPRRARTGTGCAGCRTARRAAARTASRWSAPTLTRRRSG